MNTPIDPEIPAKAQASGTANAVERAVELNEVPTASPLMKAVDVLGEEGERRSTPDERSLSVGKRSMRSVRSRAESKTEQLLKHGPRPPRIAIQQLRIHDLLAGPFPKTAGSAKRGEARGDRDARAGQDNDVLITFNSERAHGWSVLLHPSMIVHQPRWVAQLRSTRSSLGHPPPMGPSTSRSAKLGGPSGAA